MSESEAVREGKTESSGKLVVSVVGERVVTPSEMSEEKENVEATVKSVEELHALVDELQQKLDMAERVIDDKDGELCAVHDALKRAREKAASDLREAEQEKRELLSENEETVRKLETHLDEYKELLEKQEVQSELARLQALEALREKFDKERETYLSRIQHLEELESLKSAQEEPSTKPKEPETRKRDDATTSREGELQEPGVSGEEDSEKDGCSESLDSKGDPSTTKPVFVVSKSGEKVVEPVVVVSSGGGGSEATTDKGGVGSRTDDKSEKGETTGGSVRESKIVTESTSGASTSSSEPTTDGKDNELVQSVAKFIQAQTDMMAAQTRVMAAQSLPPLPHFSGEGNLVGEDSFERWVEHFEERALVAGWTGEERKYRLKMHLDRTAFQTYCNLPRKLQ